MLGALIGAAFLGAAGVFLLVVGMRASAAHAGFNQRAIETTGQVMAWKTEQIALESGTYQTTHFPEVEYRTSDGRALRHSGLGVTEPTPIGTPVALLYDPAHPESVSFTGKRGQLGLPKVLIGGGVFLIVSAILMGVLRLAFP